MGVFWRRDPLTPLWPADALRWRDDGDPAKRVQVEQIGIARDDARGLAGYGEVPGTCRLSRRGSPGSGGALAGTVPWMNRWREIVRSYRVRWKSRFSFCVKGLYCGSAYESPDPRINHLGKL